MKTRTLDHIVRNTLLDLQLPLHYYVRFLHYGIRCLEELNYDIPINVKITKLDVTSYQRAILPSDFVDVVDVSAKYGEHLLQLSLDPELNTSYNYEEGTTNKIKFPDPAPVSFDNELIYSTVNNFGQYNEVGENIGRHYGLAADQKQSYNIDKINGELVFDNALSVSEVTVTYVSDGITTSSANTVTPYAEDTINKYIKYQRSLNSNASANKIGLLKQEFVLAKKKLKSRLNALSFADILRSIRRGIHGSIKN
tara:strand:+ start:4305 stop:5063 length:759 start_codon:yes stop_codon:yes gene_type:complete